MWLYFKSIRSGQMPPTDKKPLIKKEEKLSEEDAKLLGSKIAEFKEKIEYLSKTYHLALLPITVFSPYGGITPRLTVEPAPDFFKHHKKKIITPFSGRG